MKSIDKKREKQIVKSKQKKQPLKRKKQQKKNRLLSVFLNLFFYSFMLSILVVVGLMTVMQQQDKGVNGYRIFGVLTDSMVSPDNTLRKNGFRSGDILVIKQVSEKSIKEGDVITYHPSTDPKNISTNYLTHRVVAVTNELGGEKGLFYTTRGDANKSNDMPISSKALVGKVVYVVPKVGGMLLFIKENWILSLVFVVSILGFIWVVRSYILNTPGVNTSDRGKKKRKPVKGKARNIPRSDKDKQRNVRDQKQKKQSTNKKSKRDITSSEVNINKTNRRRKKK